MALLKKKHKEFLGEVAANVMSDATLGKGSTAPTKLPNAKSGAGPLKLGLAVIAVVAVLAVAAFAFYGKGNSPGATSSSVPTSMPTTTAATSISESTTIATTSIAVQQQPNVTGNYLMTFLACTGKSCFNPQYHTTYLAQSNDGSNWTLVPGFKPYAGSVPDLVRRGGTLYLYNPGTVVIYNISTSAQSAPIPVTLEYPNGTVSSDGFVDPSPTLSNGTIVLFYLPGIPGQDPAQCPTGQSSCTKSIMSATEASGSNGTVFVVDPGVRVSVSITSPGTASDPAVFKTPTGYALYLSEGQSVVAFSSATLQGSYTPIPGLPEGVLVQQGTGGVPSGRYNPQTGQYWTYVSHSPLGGTGVIDLAITSDISSQIPSAAFSTVVSGCDFAALGCNYSVESPGIWPK